MKLIKIICGTYGHKIGGSVTPKSAGDLPFELEDAAAARLVGLNVAEYVVAGEKQDVPQADPLAYDEDMKLDRLKEIAAAYGGDASKCRSKREVIDVIGAARDAQGQAAGDGDGGDEGDGDEQPPKLTPAAPV